jgi:hypothetical protein
MTRISPGQSRATITEEPRGLRIVIPARRHALIVLFLGGWLVGWGFGEVFALGGVLSGLGIERVGPFQTPSHTSGPALIFLAVWLVGWTTGGLWALYTCLWAMVGREIVTASDRAFTIKRDVQGLGRIREYATTQVRNLRVAPVVVGSLGTGAPPRPRGMSFGPIAFDYGTRTVRFGGGLDEGEARQIVARINDRFRIPTDEPAAAGW